MKALACDICGGRLIMGTGGIATCESCGMQYNTDRMREKIQEIKGTIQLDNTSQTSNFLGMARSARNVGNNQEAENYCNKVLEIEPSNYEAWIIKGAAAAWQSTLAHLRIEEGVRHMARGINHAPHEIKQSLFAAVEEELADIISAVNSRRAERFEKWPDTEEVEGWMNEVLGFSKAHLLFFELTHYHLDKGRLLNPVAITVEQTAIRTWNRCKNDYFPQNCAFADYPDEYRWKTFHEKSDNCLALMDCAAVTSEDFDDQIRIYENAITMHEYACESRYWEFKYTLLAERWVKHPDPDRCFRLSTEARAYHTSKIAEYKQSINDIQAKKETIMAEKAKQRTEAYWKAHASERKKLETKMASLHTQISKKQAEIDAVPGREEIEDIQNKIDDLKCQKSALSLFKVKDRKSLQERINGLSAKQKDVQDRMDAMITVIQREIAPLEERLRAIEDELTRDR